MTYRSFSQIARIIYFAVLLLIIFSRTDSIAQIRCGTVEYIQKNKTEQKVLESEEGFENWLQRKIEIRKQRQVLERTAQTYIIPVVVHIIHSGEPVGIGTNISDEQIISQINVLNNDFQRLNADASLTPPEFLPVAGNIDVEFVLARRDPQGQLSDGIVRVQGYKTNWTQSDNSNLKALSYWPAEDYLNIWVCNLTDYLGYAQFPVSNLPGLETSSNNRLTDGVVIWYKTFGSKNDGSFDLEINYDLGRTLTHETGHFFGLRHIWGDVASCGGTDYVDDTPNQNGQTSGCPSVQMPGCITGEHRMYQNYLDYTDDACMNLFTQDQISRMITVLLNSPRRASLLNSLGWKEPDPVPNDLGINTIISPRVNVCASTLIPSIEIKNFGSNTITSAQIEVTLNGVTAETKTFTLNLNPLQTTTVDFSAMSVPSGTTDFSFDVLMVNNVTDQNTVNDTISINAFRNQPIAVPFTETFDVLPVNWIVKNPDQLTTWAITSAPSNDSGNNALFMNFYAYEDHLGEQDILYTPVFDLSNETLAYLTFDVAYAQFDASSTDELKILVLTDCNANLFTATQIYDKSGQSLATLPSTKQPFTPADGNQWRKEIINLSRFVGKQNVQLAFVGVNQWGNNLYLDNISIVNVGNFTDLGILSVESPSLIVCDNPKPTLLLENEGTTAITSLEIKYKINSGAFLTQSFSGLNIAPGEQHQISIPEINLTQGINVLTFTLTNINGESEGDVNPSNDNATTKVILNATSEFIPLRENFDSAFDEEWSVINPGSGQNWQSIVTNYNNSLYFPGFLDSKSNDESWLISPLLDFSSAPKASVIFQHSYAYNNNKVAIEELKVLAAVGCGNLFDQVLFDHDKTLYNTSSQTAWKPSTSGDWIQDYIDLSSFAGKKDIRLAWVVRGNNNNLYLDNIEFYASNNAEPPHINSLFEVYGTSDHSSDFVITFNLPEQQTAKVEVFDSVGKTLLNNTLYHALNQTYPVTLVGVNAGVYIVRIITATRAKSTRVFIGKP